jgi:hypothetical protein
MGGLMDGKEENRSHPHAWTYLNKRFENGIIIEFCNYCPFTDQAYTQLQLTYEKTNRLQDYDAILRYIESTEPLSNRKTITNRIRIKRYYENECLASEEGSRPYTFYVLIRVHKTWMTKKGVHREKWKQKLMTVTGRTKSEAERKLVKKIQKGS